MSKTSELETMSLCANCGKGEEAGIKLKACTACKLVKYCSRDCQIAHRPQHKKDCKKRAKELHEEKLFEQPPPLEDCPICMVRLPTLVTAQTYMVCCGNLICSGCLHAVQTTVLKSRRREADRRKGIVLCPFCRVPSPTTDEEIIKRYEKRIKLNDAMAIFNRAGHYAKGQIGMPLDHVKALKLWHRAAELGCAEAYSCIGIAHDLGRGVEVDAKKAKHYYELAAINGDVQSRYNLGVDELRAGNPYRALKHWMFAVKDGSSNSLGGIKSMYERGLIVTKEDYDKALRSYQAYVDDIKSTQRDEAAAADDNYKYFDSYT